MNISKEKNNVEKLVWHCGANTRIEGKFLIAEVPQGGEKTGGIASAESDLSEWDGKPVVWFA